MEQYAWAISFVLVFLVLIAAIVYLLWKNRQISLRNVTLQEDYRLIENKLQAAEMEGLRQKINPHLFKNILNSIQSHAYQTYFALDKLSNVLDYILYETDKKYVTVKDELAFTQNLIEINKLKLSPLFDLQVKLRVSETHPFYEQELLSPMVTVDLIENAFKHADLQNSDAFISITIELKDDFFTLTVANKVSSRHGLKKPNSGIGRDIMRRRLELLYKDCFVLDQFEENEVFISHLKINLFEHKAKLLIAG